MAGQLSEDELSTVRRLRNGIREENLVHPPGLMRFAGAALWAQAVDVAESLKGRQALAMRAVCHRMDGCDELAADAARMVERLRSLGDQQGRSETLDRILTLYKDLIVNLEILGVMSKAYVRGDHGAILDATFKRSDDDEP